MYKQIKIMSSASNTY